MLNNNKLQKGNTILIVLLLGLVLAVGGYFLFSKGGTNLAPGIANNNVDNSAATNSYVLPTTAPAATNETPKAVMTSNKISLSVTSPLDGTTLNSGSVTVSGKTSPYAEVFINDQSTKADVNGSFSLNLTLDEGSNNLTVTANDSAGNVAEQTLTVTVQSF